MEQHIYLMNSNNPVEIQKIMFALETQGIKPMIKGQKALEIGNIELTGIEGAQIMVRQEDLPLARQVLRNLGYTTGDNKKLNRSISKGYLILAAFFMIIIGYMIYKAITE